MSQVRRLPEDLVNKIAAGEVVERPASVVKELVENAIDAGASVINVEIEGGGRSLIRVRDDGMGMSREDAELALERHATSKLREVADLQAVATHGFRGEALPSIASVSDLVMRSRVSGEGAGVEVAVRQGRRMHVREAGHPQGTSVEVRDLFGAVPARRKFLRAESTEAAHVAEALTLLALARPATGFFLRSGGRAVIDAPPVEALGPRVFQLFGGRFFEGLAPVDGGEEWARVSGLVSRADGQRPPRASLRLFVNHRPVRDRTLAKAVSQAYRAAGAGDRGFEAILFVDVPPSMIDVNVHPAKTEVRFADGRTAFVAVERSVRQALSLGGQKTARADTAGVELAVQRSQDAGDRSPATRVLDTFGPMATGPSAGSTPAAEAVGDAFGGTAAAELRVLGQHRNTYIVATDGRELVLVDQHTAHERVRFEQIEEALARRRPESQLLLAPVVFDLAPELLPLLEAQTESLVALGYDAERFGGTSVRLRAVPALLSGREPAEALEALLRDFRERDGGDWVVEGTGGRLAATLACHSAVRAGQALAEGTMAAIVRDLGKTAHPALCPHGRPTSVRLPQEDVTRWFGRTGWRRQ